MDSSKRPDTSTPADLTNLLLQRSGLMPLANGSSHVPSPANPLASLLGPSAATSTSNYLASARKATQSINSAMPGLGSFSNPLAMLQQTSVLTAAIAQQDYGAPPSNNPLFGVGSSYNYNTGTSTQQPYYGVSPSTYVQQTPSSYAPYGQPTPSYGQPPSHGSYNSNTSYSNNTGQSNYCDSQDRRSESNHLDHESNSGGRNNIVNNKTALNPSLLHESERRTICRNWNNNRCDLETNCRFRHVCLRCGSDGHRERQCSLGQDTSATISFNSAASNINGASRGGQTLSASERRTVCRDYNNQRCPRPNQCKFRHVCLGCGLPDHIEKNCFLVPGGGNPSGSDRNFGYGGGREREYAAASDRRDSPSTYARLNDELSSTTASKRDQSSPPRPTHWEATDTSSSPGNDRAAKRIALSGDDAANRALTPSTLPVPSSRDPRLASLAVPLVTATLPSLEERYKVVSLPPDFFAPTIHTAAMRAIKVDLPTVIGHIHGVVVRDHTGHLAIVDYELEPVTKDRKKEEDDNDGDNDVKDREYTNFSLGLDSPCKVIVSDDASNAEA